MSSRTLEDVKDLPTPERRKWFERVKSESERGLAELDRKLAETASLIAESERQPAETAAPGLGELERRQAENASMIAAVYARLLGVIRILRDVCGYASADAYAAAVADLADTAAHDRDPTDAQLQRLSDAQNEVVSEHDQRRARQPGGGQGPPGK